LAIYELIEKIPIFADLWVVPISGGNKQSQWHFF